MTDPTRLCPACVHRRARLVAPDCPVCDGHGVLHLGRAVHVAGPVEAAHAVAIVLEATARDVETVYPMDREAADWAAVSEIRAAMDDMRAAGLIRGTTTGTTAAGGNGPALAQSVTPVTILPSDWTLPEAAAYAYQVGERPGARGMPVLSADGHPSHLARVLDPADPETPTGEAVHAATAERRGAAVLAAAAQQVAATRRRV